MAKKIFLNVDTSMCRYPSDVERIIKVCRGKGIILSALEAEEAWEDYSETLAAGWISMADYEDEEIFRSVNRHINLDTDNEDSSEEG